MRLLVATVAKLNLADFQNAVPALRELAVANDTEATLWDLTLTVSAEPPFLQPKALHLDTVGAGATYHLTALDVTLDGAPLSRLTEAEPATLRFTLTSATVPATAQAQHDQVVELLPRNQWGASASCSIWWPISCSPTTPPWTGCSKRGADQVRQAGDKTAAVTHGYAACANGTWLRTGLNRAAAGKE